MKSTSSRLTAEELRECFRFLIQEWSNGWDHFNIYKRLRKAQEKYPIASDSFSDFFNLTCFAHIETASMYLARLLDRHKDQPVSLKTFLTAAREHLPEFEHVSQPQVRKEIVTDTHWVSPKNNADVNSFLEIRHNALAHFGNERIEVEQSKRVEMFFEYDFRDVDLIERLYREIAARLNKYHRFLYGKSLGLWAWDREEDLLMSMLESAINQSKDNSL